MIEAILLVLLAAGPAASPEIEAVSLLGKELPRPAAPAELAAAQNAAIGELEKRLHANPNDAEAQVWLGRRLGYLGRYRDAVEVFTDGIARHPADPRLYRHRGHRYLTLRKIAEAAADFERGLELAAGRPDEVEPDGMPNIFNRPTSTLKTNLWYHLGLARYLQADFQRAAEAFTACAALADNGDMLVAAVYWQALSLHRAGRAEEAKRAIAAVPPGLEVIENEDYGRLLRLLSGEAKLQDLAPAGAGGGVPGATVGYGIGAWHLIAGRSAEARRAFEQVTAGNTWAAFGHLAAEAELARRR
jgi:tetratricopeptide (TPR) repeat protein